jgi:hypothetical protein
VPEQQRARFPPMGLNPTDAQKNLLRMNVFLDGLSEKEAREVLDCFASATVKAPRAARNHGRCDETGTKRVKVFWFFFLKKELLS